MPSVLCRSYCLRLQADSNPTLSASFSMTYEQRNPLETLSLFCEGELDHFRASVGHFIRHYVPIDIHSCRDRGVTHEFLGGRSPVPLSNAVTMGRAQGGEAMIDPPKTGE